MTDLDYRAVSQDLLQRLAEVTFEASQWKTAAAAFKQENDELKTQAAQAASSSEE